MYAVADITELVKLESEQKKTIDALYENEEIDFREHQRRYHRC
jgi:hypothetical protein